MPIAAIAAIGAIGSIGGAAIAGHSANKAADAQVQAANYAAGLQHQDAQAALDFQRQMYGDQRSLSMPWINTGSSAIQRLAHLMGLNLPQTSQPGAGPNNIPNFPDIPDFRGIRGGAAFGGEGFRPNLNGMTMADGSTLGPGGGNLNLMRNAMEMAPGAQSPAAANTNGQFAGANQPSTATNTVQMDPRLAASGNQVANGMTPGFLGGNEPPPQSFGAPGELGLPAGPPGPDGGPTPGTTDASGTGAIGSATDPNVGAGSDFGSLAQGWNENFNAPTNVTEQNDPGYMFRLQQGQKLLENSAAARGGLLSGNTAQDLSKFGQDYASNEYGNVYQRALGEYQQRYNVFQQNQSNLFNRLAALSGFGQTGTGQLNSAGSFAAGNVGNILMNSGAQIGQNINNAGAARASGYVGAGNAYGSALGGLGGNISNLYFLQKLLGQGGGNGGGAV
jgi:hypothetical protein